MKRTTLLAGLAGIMVAPAAATPTVDAFGALPNVDLIAVSPDGTKLALAVGDETRRQVQVRRIADQPPVMVLGTGEAKVRSLQWAGENHILITASKTALLGGIVGPKREYYLVTDFNLTTRRMDTLLSRRVDNVEKLNAVVGTPTTATIDGKPVAFVEGLSFPNERGVVTLFRVDLDTGKTRLVMTGNDTTRDFLVDATGTVVAGHDFDQKSGRSTIWTRSPGGAQKWLANVKADEEPDLKGFGRDAGTVLIAREGDEHVAFHDLIIGSETMSAVIPAMTDGDPVVDPATGRTIGSVKASGLDVRYAFFAAADTALWAKVTRAFPNAVVRLESWSDDRHKLVLRVEGKGVGAAFYLLDTTTYAASWLADQYSGIGGGDIADKTSIAYPAADGLSIPAYLTLPPGRPAKNLALVVLVYGGPSARDDPGFDLWAQALASRGYAVLQPQFRGSTGFGEKFGNASKGEWGRKMQTGLSDGVAFLAAAGTIDPRRVGIVGASYGGYAALAGVTVQHGIYRCAVSLAGPADLRAMLTDDEVRFGGANTATMRYQRSLMAAKSASDPALDAISPVRLAARVDVPVLLIHGQDDTVVPFAQSKAMAAALAKAHHPAQLVVLPGEDHWLSRSTTRIAMRRATVNFLEANLPVVVASADASPVAAGSNARRPRRNVADATS